MAKIAFWITAGPDQADKALSGLRLAQRLRANRAQDTRVYLFGPGVALGESSIPAVVAVLEDLRKSEVPVQACPANVEQMGLDEKVITGRGIELEPAGNVMIELVESGYQIVGV
ncbi:DsrE family protein [Ferrimicrobium acidiphilum]|uniref:DsrE family protein n=1 Tax=Ferrimicrobium acidiphilum TaxID=121039 RepID=UPI0023F11362|nr:DsrE family protein [Ferrimicrobium acidiphilum]MCL5052919.1 DsrE family protein [Gammaproteobacteria bacterium]